MENAILEKVLGDQKSALNVLSIIKVEHIQNYFIRWQVEDKETLYEDIAKSTVKLHSNFEY